MLKAPTDYLIIFIILLVIVMLTLSLFIAIIIYRYQQKQNAYFKDLEALKKTYDSAMLQSQLEIQEQTFLNISREIHDNIGQKLTLAKLHLNTLSFSNIAQTALQVNDSVNMISEAINDLSDISHSMNSENILNNGLIKGLEFEVAQLSKSGLYNICLTVTGDTLFLDSQKELVVFRIVQEALNNIIKHANASIIKIKLHYSASILSLKISDNGAGFDQTNGNGSGIANMKKRTEMLAGKITVNSEVNAGTTIAINIPLL
jgi:signal transduction histidine kinase